LPDSDIATYLQTIKRLRGLDVRVVHGGHDPSFGRDRLVEICDDYLARRG
jgi:glyoxylase-like metal-dependent hydrolase (beta-lactamase superfamily II)